MITSRGNEIAKENADSLRDSYFLLKILILYFFKAEMKPDIVIANSMDGRYAAYMSSLVGL